MGAKIASTEKKLYRASRILKTPNLMNTWSKWYSERCCPLGRAQPSNAKLMSHHTPSLTHASFFDDDVVARSLTLPASELCCPDLLLCRPATPAHVITPSASTPLGVNSYLCTPTQCRVCIMVLINPVRRLCYLCPLPCSFSHVIAHI
jgi:hypothetical protein